MWLECSPSPKNANQVTQGLSEGLPGLCLDLPTLDPSVPRNGSVHQDREISKSRNHRPLAFVEILKENRVFTKCSLGKLGRSRKCSVPLPGPSLSGCNEVGRKVPKDRMLRHRFLRPIAMMTVPYREQWWLCRSRSRSRSRTKLERI